MCGRFLLYTSLDKLQRAFGFHERPNLEPRYNIAPTQTVPIIRPRVEGGRELAMVQWGLVPFWAKDAKIGSRCINARAESVATAPAFREAFRRRRCVVPAGGFYEWRKLEGGKIRRPALVRLSSGEPFAFAGLGNAGKDQTANCRPRRSSRPTRMKR